MVMKTDKELKVIKKRASRTFFGRNVIPPCTLGVTLPGLGVFFGIVWSKSSSDEKDKILNILKDSF